VGVPAARRAGAADPATRRARGGEEQPGVQGVRGGEEQPGVQGVRGGREQPGAQGVRGGREQPGAQGDWRGGEQPGAQGDRGSGETPGAHANQAAVNGGRVKAIAPEANSWALAKVADGSPSLLTTLPSTGPPPAPAGFKAGSDVAWQDDAPALQQSLR